MSPQVSAVGVVSSELAMAEKMRAERMIGSMRAERMRSERAMTDAVKKIQAHP